MAVKHETAWEESEAHVVRICTNKGMYLHHSVVAKEDNFLSMVTIKEGRLHSDLTREVNLILECN